MGVDVPGTPVTGGELRAFRLALPKMPPGFGYAPAHQPVFEPWNGRSFARDMWHFELRVHLPLVNASVPL